MAYTAVLYLPIITSLLKKKTKKFVYIKYYTLFCHVNTNIKQY